MITEVNILIQNKDELFSSFLGIVESKTEK